MFSKYPKAKPVGKLLVELFVHFCPVDSFPS